MRLGLISDIHSNSRALEAVLDKLDDEEVDMIICVGDIVGNGPRPSKSVELVRKHADIVVKGNHDAYVKNPRIEKIPLINRVPHHSQIALSKEQKEWLDDLPESAEVDGYLISHSHPSKQSDLDPRLDLDELASEASEYEGFIFGHYHVQVDEKIGTTHLFNPGAVGMPRPSELAIAGKISFKPQYAVLDTEKDKVELCRTSYLKDSILNML